MIIGLSGLAGAGKSVVADVLVRELGFTRVKFADPLKNMLRTMLADMGHTAEDVERHIEGDLKEVPMPETGVTPRHMMITLGTEWGRDMVRPDLWVRLWAAKAERFERVVADDVRFPNEIEALRALGGHLWRVERPGLVSSGHVSEALPGTPDVTFVNDRSIEGLQIAARALAAGALARCA